MSIEFIEPGGSRSAATPTTPTTPISQQDSQPAADEHPSPPLGVPNPASSWIVGRITDQEEMIQILRSQTPILNPESGVSLIELDQVIAYPITRGVQAIAYPLSPIFRREPLTPPFTPESNSPPPPPPNDEHVLGQALLERERIVARQLLRLALEALYGDRLVAVERANGRLEQEITSIAEEFGRQLSPSILVTAQEIVNVLHEVSAARRQEASHT